MTKPTDDPIRAARHEVQAKDVTLSDSVSGGMRSGDVIGRYKLLQELGEGGMGTVWMAGQKEPVQRKVALKIIKLGMDTKEVVARFEAERQALAMMDHPNIAKVLDGGSTETGRPFFVMELVRGVTITEYCDTAKMGLSHRLELFAQVCNAIQHAHHKGIIHRDIKPSNVMVTLHDGVPVPKVIDFGIAKATSSELTRRTIFTQYAQMIGTPEYMAPEQAEMSGLDIDTRADIYSLGVLLYELLTGTMPFDINRVLEKGYQELLRTIREDAPAKPSTRVSSLGADVANIAARRHVDSTRLSGGLRGDLDWIVMKALEKDRTRRYDTAHGFAADIRRHLDGAAVLAAPPSAAYRIRKFVGRRKKAVAVGSLMLLLLLGGAAGTAVGWMRAADANSGLAREVLAKEEQRRLAVEGRELAERHAGLALGSLQFLTRDTLRELKTRPGTEDLRKVLMGQIIDRFDELDVGLAGGEAGTALPTLMTMRFELALALRELGESERALVLLRDVREMAKRRLKVKGATNRSRHNLSVVLEQLATALYEVDGDLQQCLTLQMQALELLPESSNEPFRDDNGEMVCADHAEHVARLEQNVGVSFLRQGRLLEARDHFAAAQSGQEGRLDYARSQPGFEELTRAQKDQRTYALQLDCDQCELALAWVQMRLGETDAAIAHYTHTIASRREIADRYPIEERPQMAMLHEKLADYLSLYGHALLILDRWEAADPVVKESCAIFEQIKDLKTDVKFVSARAKSHYRMGVLRDAQGKREDAQAAFRTCRSLFRELVQRDPTAKHRIEWMLALARCGDVTEAAALAEELGRMENENSEREIDRARCYAQLSREAPNLDARTAFRKAAFDALEKAIAGGYQDPFRVVTENDLDPLHGDPRFEELVDRIEATIAKQR